SSKSPLSRLSQGDSASHHPAMNGVGTQAWALAAPWSVAERATGAPPAPSASPARARLWPALAIDVAAGYRWLRAPQEEVLTSPLHLVELRDDVDASATRRRTTGERRRNTKMRTMLALLAGTSSKSPPPPNARGLIA